MGCVDYDTLGLAGVGAVEQYEFLVYYSTTRTFLQRLDGSAAWCYRPLLHHHDQTA